MKNNPASETEPASTAESQPEAEAPSEASPIPAADLTPEPDPKGEGSDLIARTGAGWDRLITSGAWLLALSLVLLAVYLGWKIRGPQSAAMDNSNQARAAYNEAPAGENQAAVVLPELSQAAALDAVARQINVHTIIPTRPRETVISYTVGAGDSVFSIAKDFNLKPESVLWANYDQLKDSPDMLSPGMALNIPPTNGVLYQWKDGDTLAGVAAQFSAKPEDILNWAGNRLDLTHPEIKTGDKIMVPGGKREFVQWIIPTIPRGQAGVSRSVYGPGACSGNYSGGTIGYGSFIWPTGQHVLSGNDYWSGHLGIDIAGSLGDPVYAADGGVVVFSGWATGGYGYMIMIDHGDGFQTLYAHLSNNSAGCGANVGRGQYIGAVGSTGNSTGPHLHFEVRLWGGFVNPWTQLPAP